LPGSSNPRFNVICLETINNGGFCIIAEHAGSWMPITEGKPVYLARAILHVVPVRKRSVWNAIVMMDLGDRTARFTNLPKMGISALIDATDRLTAHVLQNGTIFDRLGF
jgi:hypothetical protein